MAKKTKRRKRPTIRVYYGVNKYDVKDHLYWDIPVSLAKGDVVMRGSLTDFLQGEPGVTIGCHISNVAMSSRSTFPHEVKLMSVTKSRAIAIDKFVRGKPAHCWLYEHSLGKWVDLNDECKNKAEIVKLHPELEGKEFVLHAPRPRSAGGGGGKRAALQPKRGDNEPFQLARGALGRAIKAGLVDPGMRQFVIDDLDDAA